jgi:O-antigen/teichoic acid export membrane protein
MFAEKFLRLISGVFVGAYVARYLGPAQYGLLNYVISLVGLFSAISILGLDDILLREIVKNEKNRDTLMGTAFVLRFAAAALVYVGLIIGAESNQTDPTTRILIYIIGLGVIFQVFGVIGYFFQAKVWSKYAVTSQIVALSLISVFRIIMVLNDAPLTWFAWSTTLDYFILAAGLVIFYSKNVSNLFRWKFNGSIAAYLLRNSWSLILSGLAVTIYMRFDQIMVKWMLGDEANGHYGVGARLSEMWNFIPVAICGSLFPALINAKANSEKQYLERLQNLYDLIVGISLSIAIPLTFLSGFIINLLFGAAFAPAADILSLYIWASVFTFMGVATGKWIIIENLQTYRMICMAIAGVMNIIFNYILIKLIGLEGAAVSTLISYAFANYFFLLLIPRGRPVFRMLTRSFNFFRLLNSMKK